MNSTRQILLTRLFIFMTCFFLINCGSKPEDSIGGSSGGPSDPTISIATDLEDITTDNLINFRLSGNCSEEGQTVTVSVEDLSPETAPTCTNGSWMTEIDLTGLTGPSRVVSITADYSIDNFTATQATGSALLHPRVFIDTNLTDITSTNAATFTVSGTCSEDGQIVNVSVEDLSPETVPTCINGSWTTIFNVTSLSGTARGLSIEADHSTSNGLASLQATGVALVPPTVSVSTTLEDITESNVDDFTVSGTCSEEGLTVTVVVGEREGVSLSTALACTDGAWTTKLDVTGLNKISEVSITASQVSSDGKASAEDVESVSNNFICPANYVGVPKLSGYTRNSFCVMKYEAKSDESDTDGDTTDDNNAVSKADGTPYVSLNGSDSRDKCIAYNETSNKYDIVTNDEWQSIARNIELVPSNWDTGSVGSSGGLSRGHSDNSPGSALAASSDDTEGCFETGQTCSNTMWNNQRRTHTLSNGEVIWDVAGNVWEWVKDGNGSAYGTPAYFSSVTATTHSTLNSLSEGTTETPRNAKDQFGPSGDYTSHSNPPYGGLGWGYLDSSEGLILRGGDWGLGVFTGVFAVHLGYSRESVDVKFGFRCTFHPNL